MEYTREVTLDFSLHEVVPFVRVKQWDASTRSILVYLKKDGETYIPESDITIMFRCEKPDKRGVMLDSQFIDEELNRTLVVDNRDGTVSIELVDQCTVVPGKCYCDLCFIKDDEIISTLPFVLDVRPSPDIAKRAVSTDDFRTLANAIAGGIPSVEITEISGGHRISILDKDGTKTFDVMDGDGYSPTVSTSTITGGHRISVQDKNGTKSFDVMDGVDGTNGVDGYSPIVTTSAITGGNRVSIQDKNGTKTFNVMNGTDGTDGSDGADGYSPTVSTSTITGGHRVSIQDKNGTKTVDIMDGTDGISPTVTTSSISGGNRVSIQDKAGTKSFDVLNGTNGADGTSPTITVSDITGGHRVSTIDKSGTESFDVMDGADGISPTITTTEITGGHRLSIQDKTGSRSVDILDGEKGDKGDGFTIKKTVASVSDLPSTEAQGAYYNVGTEAPYRTYMFEVGTGWIDQGTIQGPVGHGVASGGSAGQVLKKASSDDYDTEWADETMPTKVSDLDNDTGFITGMVILSYGHSTYADFLAAYTAKKVVYCRASSNSNPASGSQTRLAFMAYVNNADNPTEVEFQYYRSVSSHTASQQGDQVFVYKLTKTAGWTVTTREASSKVVAGTNMTSSYSNDTITLNANTPTKETVGLGNVDNVQQYSATNPPPYPVTSVNGSTGAVTVPTYESKAAVSGGTDVSLVTTGEKYIWNTRELPSGGAAGQVLKKATATDYAIEWADESGASMFITFTQVGSSSSYTADKTFAEVYAAYQSGIPIFATITLYGGIYSLKSASSTYIILNYVEVNYVGNGTTEKIITFSSNESATTSTRTSVVAPIPKLVKLHLSCNNNYEYQDSPSGTFAIENAGVTLFDAYMLASMTFQESGSTDSHGVDRISLVYGSYDPVDNYNAFHAEHYELVDVYATPDDYDEGGEPIPRECRLTFRVLSTRNSEPIIKTVVITGPAYSQDDISVSSTVTYSEEELGGGGGTFMVTFSGQTYIGARWTADKTFDEVQAAFQSGLVVLGRHPSIYNTIFQLSRAYTTELRFDAMENYTDGARPALRGHFVSWNRNSINYTYSDHYNAVIPLVIHLFCDDDATYQDHPTGTFSVQLTGYELYNAYAAYCGASSEYTNTFLMYGRENPVDLSSDPYVGERYEVVAASASETYDSDWNPIENISLTFRTISMRNGVPLIKTVVISGDRFYDAYDRQPPTVTYAETLLATTV